MCSHVSLIAIVQVTDHVKFFTLFSENVLEM